MISLDSLEGMFGQEDRVAVLYSPNQVVPDGALTRARATLQQAPTLERVVLVPDATTDGLIYDAAWPAGDRRYPAEELGQRTLLLVEPHASAHFPFGQVRAVWALQEPGAMTATTQEVIDNGQLIPVDLWRGC